MRILACCSAVALLWLSPVGPAAAQSAEPGAKEAPAQTGSGENGATDKTYSINPEGATGQDAMTGTGGPGAGQGMRRTHTVPSGSDGPLEAPPLQLTEQQRIAILAAVGAEDTHQRTPANFEPRVGAAVTEEIKPHPLPRPLVNVLPELKRYYYAKLDQNVLLIDPLSMKVADVIPRLAASGGQAITPKDWAATEGRQLLGKPPETTGGPPAPSEPMMQERQTPGSSAPAH